MEFHVEPIRGSTWEPGPPHRRSPRRQGTALEPGQCNVVRFRWSQGGQQGRRASITSGERTHRSRGVGRWWQAGEGSTLQGCEPHRWVHSAGVARWPGRQDPDRVRWGWATAQGRSRDWKAGGVTPGAGGPAPRHRQEGASPMAGTLDRCTSRRSGASRVASSAASPVNYPQAHLSRLATRREEDRAPDRPGDRQRVLGRQVSVRPARSGFAAGIPLYPLLGAVWTFLRQRWRPGASLPPRAVGQCAGFGRWRGLAGRAVRSTWNCAGYPQGTWG